LKVLISGASGLVGTELAKQLVEKGHTPVRLVRRAAKSDDEIEWNPATGQISDDALEGIDAVVNLAGATTGRIPWTSAYRKVMVNSRLDSTRTLTEAINRAERKPSVLISGSASGFYGDRSDELLHENAAKGKGFLSDLASDWEQLAREAETRVVLIRTTLVMSPSRGALARLLPLIRLGLGGPIGTGRQWWAWISLRDEAAAILHLIETEAASGPYNLTAPQPATCAEVIAGLAKALNRPSWLRIPSWLMKLAFGEAAQELLLGSQKMSADRLLATGFSFQDPDLESACRYSVGK
jgi:uncharacterized protein (TIGR01777 family)